MEIVHFTINYVNLTILTKLQLCKFMTGWILDAERFVSNVIIYVTSK